MNIVETDYWCLMLPPEWSAEEEEGSVLITDQDGIGELAITTLVREPDDGPDTSLQRSLRRSRRRSAVGPLQHLVISRASRGSSPRRGRYCRSGISATASRCCIAPMPVMPRMPAWICPRWRRSSAHWCQETHCYSTSGNSLNRRGGLPV